MDQPFKDRRDGGRRLARELAPLAHKRPLVLALPRGGVPVAFEIALALGAELDIFIVRKLGLPDHEELAMGAIASGGVLVLNHDVIEARHVPLEVIQREAEDELIEIARREAAYRGSHPGPVIRGRAVILVDDGLATGASMRAAVTAVRSFDPAEVVVAVPVASPEACRELSDLADYTVCAITPDRFRAVGQWYADFRQVSDREVRFLLETYHQEVAAGAARALQ